MNFCSHCGSGRLTFRIPEGDTRPRFCCEACGTIHYQNPLVVVGAIARWEGRILLCRRAIEPRAGYWNLPAGFLENGETLAQGAARETLEEAGATIEIERLHSVYDIPHVRQLYVFFLANMHSKAFESGPESLETALFLPEEIPFDDLAFTSNHYALRRYIEMPEFAGVHISGYPALS